MQYSQEQGLLGRNMTLDELFVSTGGAFIVTETCHVAA